MIDYVEKLKQKNKQETLRAEEIRKLINAIEALRSLEMEHSGAQIKDGQLASYGFLSFNNNAIPLSEHFDNGLLTRLQERMNKAIKDVAAETAAILEARLMMQFPEE